MSSNDKTGLQEQKFVTNRLEVVLEKNSNIRIAKSPKGLPFTTKNEKSLSLENTLSSLGVVKAYDLTGDMSEKEIEADYKRIQSTYKGEVLTRYDFHTYEFKENTDLLSAVKTLRQLPFIKAANLIRNPEISTFTKQQLSRLKINEHTVTKSITPNDNGFRLNPESKWWYFNKHQILKGWEVYGSTPMPTIAVIDTGFDTGSGALDKPNYLNGVAITQCSAIGESSCAVTYNPVEPTHSSPISGFSHGTMVSSVLGAPLNGSFYAGVAPNTPIYPIRIADSGYTFIHTPRENVITAMRHAASKSNVDVINLSMSASNMCPYSMNDAQMNYEIASAISAGKIVVAAAGNKLNDLQDSRDSTICNITSTAGEIVVGGVQEDTSVDPHRMSGWFGDPALIGSNYDSTGNIISLAAGANNVSVNDWNPNSGIRSSRPEVGTSLATPMVAAAAGMVKKIAVANGTSFSNSQINEKIKDILIATTDLTRSTPGDTSNGEGRTLGANLVFQSGAKMVGARTLNLNNALTVAKNLSQYDAIVRTYNVDDVTWASVNEDWTTGVRVNEDLGYDSIWGYNGLNSGDSLDFWTYLFGGPGSYAYGYHVFRNDEEVATDFGGVSNIAGVNNNVTPPTGWYAVFSYIY